jgi:hypothetical protein
MRKKVKMIMVDHTPYVLIDNNICLPPSQIGFAVETLNHETTTEFWQSEIKDVITSSQIDRIISNDGYCEIEMEDYTGDGAGYRLPKLIDNKVIIYL